MENSTIRPFYNTTVPSDWRIVRLKNLGKVGSGTTPSTIIPEYWLNGTIPWLPTGKVNDKIIKDSQTFITEKALQDKGIKLLPMGSVVIAMIGQGKTRGKTALLEIEAWVNQNFAFIIPNQSVDSRYLYTILDYNYGRIRYEGNRGGNQGSLNAGMIKDFKIPLAPLSEQRAIAQILSLMDTAINQNNKIIAQKELRKNWLMQNLLTGKKRLKGFCGDWKEYSYEKLLKIVKRNFEWDENELYKLISVRRRSDGIFFREALYGHQILVKTLRTAKEGDFLFSKMQILHGASALVTKEFDGAKISGSYIAVVAKDKKQLNMEFFQWYSQVPYFYHQTYISSYGVHIEKMTFDFETFLQLETKLPDFEEQTAIAQVLQAADKEILLLKAKTDKLREQKKGMMQVLLTGKVRIKNLNL